MRYIYNSIKKWIVPVIILLTLSFPFSYTMKKKKKTPTVTAKDPALERNKMLPILNKLGYKHLGTRWQPETNQNFIIWEPKEQNGPVEKVEFPLVKVGKSFGWGDGTVYFTNGRTDKFNNYIIFPPQKK